MPKKKVKELEPLTAPLIEEITKEFNTGEANDLKEKINEIIRLINE